MFHLPLQRGFRAIDPKIYMKEKLAGPVQKVLTLLIAGKYKDIEALTHGVRLNSKAIGQAVADYGKKIIMPPADGFQLMNVVEVKNAQPRRWSIAMPLWTNEEGRSDLTLELTVVEETDGFTIELDDLHVL